MTAMPYNKILQFNPDIKQAVRKEYGLDKPGRLDEAIDILDSWVKKQEHFVKKDFSRQYLENTLIMSKGLVERAKTRIDKLCTFKSLMPDFFQDPDVRKLSRLKNFLYHAGLPKMTKDNYRVYALKVMSDDFESSEVFKYYKYIVINSEYIRKYDYCTGFVLILDYRDVNPMSLATKLNPIDMKQAYTLLTDGYGMRIKGIHVITPSKMVDVLVSLFKQVLSTKIGDRIQVHKAIDTVYDSVPKEILPVEFGGDEMSLKKLNEMWIDELSSNEFMEYLTDINKATTNESYRQTDKFNETYLGTPGSFRSFSVD